MSDVVDMAEERLDFERARLSGIFQARVSPSGVTECEDCGDTIPAERLAAAPFATRCLHCQELFEKDA